MMTGQATRMIGATMYASGHPCPRCLPILLSSGIKRIVYERYGYTNYDEESVEMIQVVEAFGAVLEPFGVEHPLPLEEKRGSKPRKPGKHSK
jgi:tRNA(Arg) A34 adenosine deaminase TadA